MLDPKRYELPETVLALLAALEQSFAAHRVPNAVEAARHLAGYILRMWGGIQAYIPPPDSKLTPRFIAEVRDWAHEGIRAQGVDDFEAEAIADSVAADLRAHFAGVILYLPKDRWTYRADVARRFNGKNQVELCREHGLTTATLYKIVAEERESMRGRTG